MQVVDADAIVGGAVADLVGSAVERAAPDAAAGRRWTVKACGL